jgi:hypothetical protein
VDIREGDELWIIIVNDEGEGAAITEGGSEVGDLHLKLMTDRLTPFQQQLRDL